MAFLDGSVINVALPAIKDELGGGLASQQWVVDSYLLTLGAFMLLAGSLSDLLGRRKIFDLGLVGFGAASLLCAAAPSDEFLIGARALQGIAGALLVPSSLALIMANFDGPAQGKAIGSWTAWTGISFIIGPLLGGFLIDTVSWRLIFAINVLPIAFTVYMLSRLPKESHPRGATVDWLGALLGAFGLAGPVYALIEQPVRGWADPLTYGPLAAGAALLALFVWRESRAEAPMMPLSLFRRRNFSVGNVATLAVYGGFSGALFLLTIFLQQVAGYSATAAGVSVMPVAVIMFLLSTRFGHLAGTYGPRLFMGLGPVIGGIGLIMFLLIDTQADYVRQVLPGILVFGIGLAVTVAPLTAAILGDVDKARSGIASAVNNSISRIAGLLAVAIVGAVIIGLFNARLDAALADATTPLPSDERRIVESRKGSPLASVDVPGRAGALLTDATLSSFHQTAVFMGLVVIAGGLVSLVGIRNPRRRQAA